MNTRNTANARVTVATLASSNLSSQEAGMMLPLAAAAAIKGKATIEQGKAQGASALAVMVAGFASDEFAERAWSFDIMVKGQVHHHVETVGAKDMWNDSAAWMLNGEGKVSRESQTAYKLGFVSNAYKLKDGTASVWTATKNAVQIANAIRAENMVATIEGGKLVLSGGTTDKAKAMIDAAAKSLSALAKVAKDATGTSRNSPQNSNAGKGGEGKGKGGEGGEGGEGEAPTPATPEKILRDATWIVQAVAKGDIALGGSELSFIRAIAKAVNENPDVFAPDVPED
jgi:hypothetical protein